MRDRIADRLNVTPERYQQAAKLALFAIAIVVLAGAAVRVTGSGLGCPSWPQCYDNGRVVAESNLHAIIEFTNRIYSAFVGLIGFVVGLLAFFRRPYRRDLMWLGGALLVGVMVIGALGAIMVRSELKPGWLISHFLVTMVLLAITQQLFWRARTSYPSPPGAPDRATGWLIRGLVVLGAFTVVVGTIATGSGPHAGSRGTGEVVSRIYFKGSDTLEWVVQRHSLLAALLGAGIALAWVLNSTRGGSPRLQKALNILVCLVVAQGIVGILQYNLELPAELVWIHVGLATYTWISILFVASAAGMPPKRAAAPADPEPAPGEQTAPPLPAAGTPS